MIKILILLLLTVSLAYGAGFEKANPSQYKFLAQFALHSNDIYKTRKTTEQFALDFFKITKNEHVEILKEKNEIVGFIALEGNKLTHLFVKAGLQGKGYGTMLFKRAASIAERKLTWYSSPSATNFYLKMGGKIIGYVDNPLDPGTDVPLFVYIPNGRALPHP